MPPCSTIRWANTLLLFTLLVYSCARPSTGPPFQPPEAPTNHRARLVLYRTDKQASLASVLVTIDGRELGRFRNREYETRLLTPGTHFLRAGSRGFALISWGWNSLRFRVEAGETTYIEISVRLDARETSGTKDLEIAGRQAGAASENIFIVPKSAHSALDDLQATTRLVPGDSDSN